MPTVVTNFAFGSGQTAIPGYGDRWLFGFSGTWSVVGPIVPERWQILLATSEGNITLGIGNFSINADLTLAIPSATVALVYRERAYVGVVSQVNYSDNDNITGWEEQDPGAGFIRYLSQYGAQDAVVGLALIQGRVAFLGRRSIQIWNVDADPANFSLAQVLDNTGTFAKLSVQQQGDFDVIYLDDTGVRSLRTKEVTLGAYIDDIGSPIDEFIRTALDSLSEIQKATSCGIVEPATKNYWLFVKDTLYVLSRHPSSKISAWSTYEPRGDDNQLFVPLKFVVLTGRVYLRGTSSFDSRDYLYTYGGVDNTTYDQYSQVTLKTPYLDDKRPGTMKQFAGLSVAKEGKWTVSIATDPQSNNYVDFLTAHGSATSPNVLADSTYDIGNVEAPLKGTHFSVKAISASISTSAPVVLGALLLYYNPAELTG